jgi:GWxTD domain-containing protein
MKMNFKRNRIALAFVTAFLLYFNFSCKTPNKISNQNLSYSYRKSESIIHPQFSIQHISAEQTLMHFSISTSELLYVKSGESKTFTARVALTYRLLTSYDAKEAIDTGSVIIVDKDYSDKANLLIAKTEIRAIFPNNYVLEVVTQDLNRNISAKSIINIYKSSFQNSQNFILTDINFKQPIFRNILKKDETVFLNYTGLVKQSKIYVRYYNRQFPMPAPAFSTFTPKPFDYKADSIFAITLDTQGTAKIHLEKLGFYHFQLDTTLKEGFTVFRFNDEFPYLTAPELLVPMLRFITTRQEFEDLMAQSDKKKAVDDFWLKNGGNNERAKSILKTYYSRAQEANLFFTSYCEGWKTDRGLIYTIFGQPNTLYKQDNSETWVYGEDASYKSLSFVFIKVINPFSDNDYQLNRSDMFKDEWYKGVDAWRQGRAYNEH